MISVKIKDIPKFMSILFSSEILDSFFVVEEYFKTYCDFKIDGRINMDFFLPEEQRDEFNKWETLRLTSRELIKGKKLPLKMHIIFMVPENMKELVETDKDYSYEGNDLKLLFNLKYEEEALTLVTGSSTGSFTLNKSYEAIFDRIFIQFIDKLSVQYELL